MFCTMHKGLIHEFQARCKDLRNASAEFTQTKLTIAYPRVGPNGNTWPLFPKEVSRVLMKISVSICKTRLLLIGYKYGFNIQLLIHKLTEYTLYPL